MLLLEETRNHSLQSYFNTMVLCAIRHSILIDCLALLQPLHLSSAETPNHWLYTELESLCKSLPNSVFMPGLVSCGCISARPSYSLSPDPFPSLHFCEECGNDCLKCVKCVFVITSPLAFGTCYHCTSHLTVYVVIQCQLE